MLSVNTKDKDSNSKWNAQEWPSTEFQLYISARYLQLSENIPFKLFCISRQKNYDFQTKHTRCGVSFCSVGGDILQEKDYRVITVLQTEFCTHDIWSSLTCSKSGSIVLQLSWCSMIHLIHLLLLKSLNFSKFFKISFIIWVCESRRAKAGTSASCLQAQRYSHTGSTRLFNSESNVPHHSAEAWPQWTVTLITCRFEKAGLWNCFYLEA